MLNNFFKNPFNQPFEAIADGAKVEILSRAEKRACGLYADKPFGEEYKGIANTAILISLFAGIISFFTAIFALQSILYFTVGATLSWAFAGAICAAFEVLKTLIWKVTAKNKLRYQKAVGGLIVSLIFLHLFSLASSGYGAYLIPENFAPTENADTNNIVAKIDNAALLELQNIDKQIENIDAQISDLTPYILTPSGKKSSVTAGQITTLQGQKTALLAAKDKAKNDIQTIKVEGQNAAAAAAKTHGEKAKKLQLICVSFAVFFELLYIVCVLFLFYYDFRVYVDATSRGAHPSPQNTLQNAQKQVRTLKKRVRTPKNAGAHPQTNPAPTVMPQPAPAANAPQPRKIGFFNTGQIDADGDTQPPNQPYYIVVKNGAGYEILYNSATINSSKNNIILARVQRKIYTKDRVNSNLTAAKNKAKKGEPTAPARVQFWGEIKAEIERYDSVVNPKSPAN